MVFLQRWALNHRLVGCVFKAPTWKDLAHLLFFFSKTKVGEMFGSLCCKMFKNVTLMSHFTNIIRRNVYDRNRESNRRPCDPRPAD